MIKKILKISLTAIALFLTTQISLANSEAFFTTYPSFKHQGNTQWIIQELQPGSKYTDYFTIENLSNQFQTFNIDFKETTGSVDNIKILENENFSNLGNWQQIPLQSITLYPREKRKIPIYFQVPESELAGDVQGVILVSNSKYDSITGNIINTRIGNRVYLKINPLASPNSSIIPQNKFQLLNLNLIIISLFGIYFGLIIKNNKNKLVRNNA